MPHIITIGNPKHLPKGVRFRLFSHETVDNAVAKFVKQEDRQPTHVFVWSHYIYVGVIDETHKHLEKS